jgi:hypothetical protein
MLDQRERESDTCCLYLRKQRGRLKLCSESILFDPVDFSDPVIKVIKLTNYDNLFVYFQQSVLLIILCR